MKVRGLERLEGCRVERLEGQRVEWLEGQGVEWLEGQGVERLEGQRMERLEGQRTERLEGVIVGDFGSTPNIIRPSKPKPYGSLYLPPFLPYTFHTKILGGDLRSPPSNKIYSPGGHTETFSFSEPFP